MLSLLRPLSLAALIACALPATAQTIVPAIPPSPVAKDSISTGQDDLAQLLINHDDTKPKCQYAIATFKATRIINGQSNENLGAGVLDFIILHRFGRVNQGAKDFYGLDNANTRIGFGYGITNWLMVGIGRSSYDKEYDGFAKVKILRQHIDNKMPISLSLAGTVMAHTNTAPTQDTAKTYYFSNRLSYCSQLIIARKFSDRFSLQLTPSLLHINLVPGASDPNNIYSLGIGGRVKLTKRFSLNAEYFPTVGDHIAGYHNSISVGVDIETGGHVFQLHFTNSTGMSERTFIGLTDDRWENGGIHFGFNISRVFTIVKPKDFR